ncbi:MAG TPA: hypothetical protein VL484_13530 [Vicinamibacterales bacterium]|jgi:quercetin dioxygenase-like cupin family protein|nr:hypothetical protein [Vicinamibacterales bacterium]
MKAGLTVLVAVAMVAAVAGTSRAQDPVKVDPGHYKVIVDNPSVRVLRITYAAGAKSKMHEHPDAIVVVLSSGKMQFATPDGKTEDRDLPADTAMFTPAVTHNPSNIGKTAMDAILVEFKSKAGTATIPTDRPNMKIKSLAEAPQGSASLVSLEPGFHEPAGTKHDYDQVVIALGPTPTSLAIDGKPAKTTWKRGDVSFIGRGVAHESKFSGDKPADVVIVAIK